MDFFKKLENGDNNFIMLSECNTFYKAVYFQTKNDNGEPTKTKKVYPIQNGGSSQIAQIKVKNKFDQDLFENIKKYGYSEEEQKKYRKEFSKIYKDYIVFCLDTNTINVLTINQKTLLDFFESSQKVWGDRFFGKAKITISKTGQMLTTEYKPVISPFDTSIDEYMVENDMSIKDLYELIPLRLENILEGRFPEILNEGEIPTPIMVN